MTVSTDFCRLIEQIKVEALVNCLQNIIGEENPQDSLKLFSQALMENVPRRDSS